MESAVSRRSSSPKPSVLVSLGLKGSPLRALLKEVLPTLSKPTNIQRAHQHLAEPCSKRLRRKATTAAAPCDRTSEGGTRSASQPFMPSRLKDEQSPILSGKISNPLLPLSCNSSKSSHPPQHEGRDTSLFFSSHTVRSLQSVPNVSGRRSSSFPENHILSNDVHFPSSSGRATSLLRLTFNTTRELSSPISGGKQLSLLSATCNRSRHLKAPMDAGNSVRRFASNQSDLSNCGLKRSRTRTGR
mmetsp:Transcript_51386/g.122111  ORF Transcript_51386/g.122111 Transcript_51386/m.122111 type:complete len:244 (+) Transcript_51386:1845-2576(+)